MEKLLVRTSDAYHIKEKTKPVPEHEKRKEKQTKIRLIELVSSHLELAYNEKHESS